MTLPSCPDCRASTWTATYRARVERTWLVTSEHPNPHLDYEDEDFGEWDEGECSSCGYRPIGQLASEVRAALLGPVTLDP